jgi:hypothetical protein
MNYTGLGANPDGSVTSTVNADLSDVKHIIENVSNGREQKTISGSLKITDEYDDFGLYLNDTTGYYIDYTDYSYTMARNGEALEVGKIQLIENNEEDSVLTFKLYDEVFDKYQEIYSKWETDLNIFTYTGGGGGTIVYSDFRTLNTKTTQVTGLTFEDQAEWESYVDDLIESDDYWTPVFITWSLAGQIDIDWEQFRAGGTYVGSDKWPPDGIGWTYDTDVSGSPVYKKKPKNYRTDYGTLTIFDPNLGSASDTTIYVEQIADISYTTASYSLKTLIGIFCSSQFGGLSNDLSGFDDFVGETLPVGHPAYASAYNDLPYRDIEMIPMSDFIPTLAGDQRSTRSTAIYLNFKTISDFIKSFGFIWYLDYSGGGPVLKVQHYSLKILGSSNPSLTNYYNKNRLFRTKNFKILESEFDVLTNSVEGRYEFSDSEYRFFDGNKKKEIIQTRIYTNINHIIDAKEAVFDAASGKNWAALLTTLYSSTYYTRYIGTDVGTVAVNVNNYEASFYWLVRNNLEMPGRKSTGGDEFAVKYTAKRKEISLTGIPIDNPQTDFSVYDYISYFGDQAEIQRIEMPTLSRNADITIKIH